MGGLIQQQKIMWREYKNFLSQQAGIAPSKQRFDDLCAGILHLM